MFFILQAQPAPGPFGGMSSLIFMGMIMLVFWLFFIRPQAKKQKEAQNFLQALRVGDQVITNSGILGRITALTDVIATLEVANQVQIKVLRAQIAMSQSALQTAKKEGN